MDKKNFDAGIYQQSLPTMSSKRIISLLSGFRETITLYFNCFTDKSDLMRVFVPLISGILGKIRQTAFHVRAKRGTYTL